MLKDKGLKVFCDLKLHDIPRTMQAAVRELMLMDVDFFTVHGLSGPVALKAVAETIADVGAARKNSSQALAVSVLTHHTDDELQEIGLNEASESMVLKLFNLALSCGISGGVCSPLEVKAVRKAVGSSMTLVCPGIRPTSIGKTDDQRRTASASQAISMGADYLVVGRPIVASLDPAAAAEAMLNELHAHSAMA
jgi:orotidine-5'-phosphate decarboxylase